MKSIQLSVLSVLLGVLCGASLQAQTVFTTIVNGGTNNVAASTTNDYSALSVHFTFPRHQDATFQAGAKLTASSGGASNIVFVLDSSVDASNWVLAVTNVTVAATSNSVISAKTDLNTGGSMFWRLNSIRDANGVAATNLYLSAGARPGL